MKKILFTMLAASTMLFSSCSKDTATEPVANADTTTFTVTLDDNMGRATTESGAKRYIMEIFNEDGTPANLLDGKNHKEVAAGSFVLTLDKTKAYTCIFWADGSAPDDNAKTFDASSLKAVKLNDNQHATDAFYTHIAVEKGKNPTVAVTLKRAVAKVSLVETAGVEIGKKITVSCSQPTLFNALTGTVSTPKNIVNEGTIAVNKDKIYEFRLFSSVGGETADITFNYNGEKDKAVTAVPVKQNFNTNLKGEFSSLITNTFNITTDENWETPDFESKPNK